MKKNFLMAIMAVAAIAVSAGMTSCDDNNGTETPTLKGEELKGEITGERTLDANTLYNITAPVFVTEGATLTIPAGTRIEANVGFHSYIMVLQGGKIFVNGTDEAPVVMTSAAEFPKAGDWGGLVINGYGKLAGGETNVKTEVNPAYTYGGTVADDNSGSIKYLTLAYTGYKDQADVEHNGLTLNGVGSGTTIENIYVPYGSDDGIEFFGGSVNVTNLLVVNSDDDMFDFTRGYNGTLTNAYGLWEATYGTTETDPSGIEADGNFDGNRDEDTDESNFTVENVTFDLRQYYNAINTIYRMQQVMRVRRDAIANVKNALVKGIGRAEMLINLTDSKGNADPATNINVTNNLTIPNPLPTGYVAIKDVVYPTTTIANDNYVEADYKNITVGGTNSGCPASIFAWTGYRF